jgi:hypothetical protein
VTDVYRSEGEVTGKITQSKKQATLLLLLRLVVSSPRAKKTGLAMIKTRSQTLSDIFAVIINI